MKTILVIEDDPATRENLVLMLEMEGYEALSAHNGIEGIKIARERRPDLILCDVSMPELNGHGVLSELRKSPSTVSTPFLFLTARGEKKDLRQGMNLGADDYLTKPAGAEEVLTAIRSRLTRHDENEWAVISKMETKPNFDSSLPLEALGLTPREAEVLLWVAQGKSNSDIGVILGCAENTVKVHLARVFEKLGFENRNAATVRALEILTEPRPRSAD